MRSIVLFVLSLVWAIDGAYAADMYPRPEARRLPVFSWTGFFLGANAGYGWASYSGSTILTNGPSVVSGDGSAKTNGAIVGGQFGANYQAGMAVVGFEIDGQWSGNKDPTPGCDHFCVLSQNIQVNAFGTVRGRFGVAIDRVLLYASAGGAWTNLKSTVVTAVGGLPVASTSGFTAGWTVGAGLEIPIATGFSARFEYLYIETNQIRPAGILPGAVLGGGQFAETGTLHHNIARAGINYRFGSL